MWVCERCPDIPPICIRPFVCDAPNHLLRGFVRPPTRKNNLSEGRGPSAESIKYRDRAAASVASCSFLRAIFARCFSFLLGFCFRFGGLTRTSCFWGGVWNGVRVRNGSPARLRSRSSCRSRLYALCAVPRLMCGLTSNGRRYLPPNIFHVATLFPAQISV